MYRLYRKNRLDWLIFLDKTNKYKLRPLYFIQIKVCIDMFGVVCEGWKRMS